MIDSGADIDAKDNNGRTPLHEAAADVARLLIKLGADIEAKDNNGWKPLHEAVANDSLDVTRLLIEHGANTDGIDLSWMN
jgi:ankyrin repeat protein